MKVQIFSPVRKFELILFVRLIPTIRLMIGSRDKGSLREVAKRREGSELHAGGVLEPERDRAAARRWREATEGECVTMKLSKCNSLCNAGSFHHFVVPLPPGGRLDYTAPSLTSERMV